MGYDNGDIFGGENKWVGWSVDLVVGVDFLCGRRMIGDRFGAEGVISSFSFQF